MNVEVFFIIIGDWRYDLTQEEIMNIFLVTYGLKP